MHVHTRVHRHTEINIHAYTQRGIERENNVQLFRTIAIKWEKEPHNTKK